MGTLPSYAKHLGKKAYSQWVKTWRYSDYTLPQINTAQDAAALLMIAANDGDPTIDEYWNIVGNDGRNIAPLAALAQYKKELAHAGMELALCEHFDMAYGIRALGRLVAVMAYDPRRWEEKTVNQLAGLFNQLGMDTIGPEQEENYDLYRAHNLVFLLLGDHGKENGWAANPKLKESAVKLVKNWIRATQNKDLFYAPRYLPILEHWGTKSDIENYSPIAKDLCVQLGSESKDYREIQAALKKTLPKLLAS